MRSILVYVLGTLLILKSASATCNIEHNAYGEFKISGSGTWGSSCTLTLDTWAGVATATANVVSSYSQGYVTRASLGNRAFKYGLPYTFTLTGTCGVCTGTVSKTPTLCTDSIANPSYMAPLVKPLEKLSVVVQKPPVGSNCYHIVTDSTATGTRTTPSAVACNSAPLLAWPGSSTGTWYVNMVKYSTAPASLATSQPSCGVSEVVIPTPACTTAQSFSLASWDSVKVSVFSKPNASYKCVVTLTEWSDTVVSISKVSPDCTSVVFSNKDTGILYDNSKHFSAEYYMYANDKDLNSDNPDCVKVATRTTTLRPTALLGADLTIQQPDPKTVRVTIDPAKAFPYGTCEVRLTSSNSPTSDIPSVPISRYGPCSGNFDFTVDGVTIKAWAASTKQFFFYYFYPDGDILSTTRVGPSSAVSPDYVTPATFILPALSVVESPAGTYEFIVASPQPQAGGCALHFSDSASTEGYIPWPGCDKIRINYYDMLNAESSIEGPGASFDFKIYYYYNGYSSGTSADVESLTAISQTIYLNHGLVLSSATGTSLTVALGSVTAPLGGATNHLATLSSVRVNFYGCNSVLAANPAVLGTKTVSSPSGSTTFTFTNGETAGYSAISIQAGQTCYFDLQATTTADVTGSVPFSGYSGIVSFVAAGAPSWSGVALPRVMLYGTDCVRLVWTKVADPINAPVTCYTVVMASASTSGGVSGATPTVVRPCSDPNTLIPDYTYCSLTSSLFYSFSINAVNMQGSSSIQTSVFKLSDLQADKTLVYAVTVNSVSNRFAAGTFPVLTITWAPTVVPPTNLILTRLLVGVLMNLATLDTNTKTIPIYTLTSGQYTGPLSSGQAFPFVQTYTYRLQASNTNTYYYDLIVPFGTVTTAGQYSVVTYAVQGGGLLGQYWSNVDFSGVVTAQRVDPQLDFDWGTGPVFSYGAGITTTQVYDMLSVRWTGFIEAEFSELYTFYLETNAQVMVWIDNVPIISKWENQGPCAGVCTGQYQLVQSVLTSTSNVGERKFHHIRIDAIFARGSDAAAAAMANLQWSSASQTKEVIPSNRLFSGNPIYGYSGSNYQLPTVVIEPAAIDQNSIAVSVSSTEVMAMDTFYVNITTKDVYGNVVPTTNEQFKVEQAMSGQSTLTDYSVSTPGSSGSYFVPLQWQYPGALTLTVSRIVNGAPVSLSTIPVTIVPGPIAQLSMNAPGGSITAGVDVDLIFIVKDASTNEVTITPTMDLTPIAITATWTGDSSLSLVTPDDTAARIQRYSTTFNPVSVTPSIGSSAVTARMNLPFKGTYSLSFVYGDNAPQTSTLTVLENLDSVSGEYSVVTTASFPRAQLVVSENYVINIRLRDVYMNPITSSITYPPHTVPVVVGKIGSSTATCLEDSTDSYSFRCTFSPTVVGTALPLSITVNGKHVSYIQGGAQVRRIQGPWTVNVTPGTYSAANSLVLGLQEVYVVGVPTDLTIVLRDSDSNLVNAAPATCPAVEIDIGPTTYTPAAVCNTDGTISVVLTPTTQELSAVSFTLTVGGTQVTVLSPSSVTVLSGFATASTSTCQVTPSTPMTVGFSPTVTCTPLDVGSNPAIDQGYSLRANVYMRKQSGTTVISQPLSLSGTDYTTSTGLAPTSSGVYDYYVEFGQPGGLIAKYFQYVDFTQVVGISTGVITAPLFPGDPELRYTRIDPAVNFDWTNEGLSIGNTIVRAVEWSGYVYFPTGTVSCTVSGNGYVEFWLGDALTSAYTNFGASSAAFSTTVSVTASTLYKIKLRYVPPASGDKEITFRYTGTSSLVWVVPPIYLSAPLPIAAASQITFVAGLIYSGSTTFSYQSNIIKGQNAAFYFYPKDLYGNALGKTSCDSITFDLIDASGATVANTVAWGSSATGPYTVTCSSLTAYPSSDGFYGTLKIEIDATDYSIRASVAATGVTTFTYTVSGIDVTTPSS